MAIPTRIPATDPKANIKMHIKYLKFVFLGFEATSIPKQNPTTNLCEHIAPNKSRTF